MIYIENQTLIKCKTKKIKDMYKSLTEKEVEVLLVDNKTIKQINFEYRGINKSTDVLSFPVEPFPNSPLGSIVISLETAQEIANELSHTLEDEIALMFIHGYLHLNGFDHEIDNGEMLIEEKKLIEKFNLPKSLISRTFEV